MFHFYSNALVIWENQTQQETKSEKQQAVTQCFNFSAEIQPFGKHWMADDRSENLNTEEFLSMRFFGELTFVPALKSWH